MTEAMGKNLIFSALLLASTPFYPIQALEANMAEVTPSITIQYDNGTSPQPVQNLRNNKQEDQITRGDGFSLALGETFSVGAGSSFFTLKDFPSSVEQIQLFVEISPGDSGVNLSLPGGVDITTNQPQTTRVWVKEGKATSIAYGYDAATNTRIKFTYEAIK